MRERVSGMQEKKEGARGRGDALTGG